MIVYRKAYPICHLQKTRNQHFYEPRVDQYDKNLHCHLSIQQLYNKTVSAFYFSYTSFLLHIYLLSQK